MTSEEIKAECEQQRIKIHLAEKKIEELQFLCKHENKLVGKWSWRIGCIDDAVICSDCKSFIEYLKL